MANSKQFPEIDFYNFKRLTENMEQIGKFDQVQVDDRNDRQDLTLRNKLELVFIRSTRNDDTHGLSSCLCRSELLEAVVRLATNIYFPEDAHQNPAMAMNNFVSQLMKPFCAESEIQNVRYLIQSD